MLVYCIDLEATMAVVFLAYSPQDELLTVEEVAGIYRVKSQTVRKWIRDGRLGVVVRGRRYLVPRRVLENSILNSVNKLLPSSLPDFEGG
jgi:excisionase family DNA binding protein